MAELIRNMAFKNLVGGVIMLAFLSGHIAMLFIEIPKGNESPFIHSLGLLDTAVAMLVGYYYGSSSGSKEKSEQLNKALKTEQDKNE